MSKIAIVSTEKLQFPPASIGFVEMNIDLIQNKPQQKIYELRIIDTCFDWVEETYREPIITPSETEGEPPTITYSDEEKTRTVKKILGSQTRLRTYTYEQLSELAKILNLDRSKFETETDYINELFRQGLFIMTQQECQQGISGEGKGMYFSRTNQWEIVIEKINSEDRKSE